MVISTTSVTHFSSKVAKVIICGVEPKLDHGFLKGTYCQNNLPRNSSVCQKEAMYALFSQFNYRLVFFKLTIRCLMLYHINDEYALLMATWPMKATSFL